MRKNHSKNFLHQVGTSSLLKDVKSYIRATCFDSTESSSGPRVSDPYKEPTTHCGIPNAYNKNKITKLCN